MQASKFLRYSRPLIYEDCRIVIAAKHPKTLWVFFTTEMWERYGFYVVQTLLALYLALHFGQSDKEVYAMVGSFTALNYLSPLLGGWIADYLLGQRFSILLGLVVLFVSYCSLGWVLSKDTLCFSLAGIVVGTGLLKPNISALLGNEYPEGSIHRDNGFTIFYMGLATGIILGTTLPSYLQESFGWSVAFVSASCGMVLAALIFTYGMYHYAIRDYHAQRFSLPKILMALALMLGLWLLAVAMLHYTGLADTVFILVAVSAVLYLCFCIKNEPPIQGRQTMVIGLLCLISVMFWAFYFQMFLSLTLFILRVVNPKIFGFSLPPPAYVGIQSIGIIGLGLVLSTMKQTPQRQAIRTGNKFLTAMLCMSIAYSLITIICHFKFPAGLLSPLYIIPAYLLIALAELLLSPVGLSAVTMLASRKKASTMMGIFFVSLGIGSFLAGKLAIITAVTRVNCSVVELKTHYAQSFGILLVILLFATAFCVFLNMMIKKLMIAET